MCAMEVDIKNRSVVSELSTSHDLTGKSVGDLPAVVDEITSRIKGALLFGNGKNDGRDQQEKKTNRFTISVVAISCFGIFYLLGETRNLSIDILPRFYHFLHLGKSRAHISDDAATGVVAPHNEQHRSAAVSNDGLQKIMSNRGTNGHND